MSLFATLGGFILAQEPATPPPTLRPRVQVQTTGGDFVLELNAELAPRTVLNFVAYAEAGFYNGTLFHRVVAPTPVQGGVVQGGAYTVDMTEKKDGLKDPIPSEAFNGLKNEKGTVAMYRIPGDLNSARAQFFINTSDNPALDKLRDKEGYTVFGRVVDGTDVIERIRDAPVGAHPKYATGKSLVVPVTPIVINSIRVLSRLDKAEALSLAKANEITSDQRLNNAILRIEKQHGKKMVATESGVRYLDIREGQGAFPLVSEAVEINYIGTLVDGREFDTSDRQTDGQGPHVTNVATTIRGVREGLLGMREGGKRVLIVPPELAYGSGGIPGRVPGDATLIFEVELLAVKPAIERPLPRTGAGSP